MVTSQEISSEGLPIALIAIGYLAPLLLGGFISTPLLRLTLNIVGLALLGFGTYMAMNSFDNHANGFTSALVGAGSAGTMLALGTVLAYVF